ncbi:hypothetical protein DNK49_19480 [Azoarcus communis]|uniref:YjiS-like domain-containing protein n=1 Tax=Parazoarcus communis SWub3 = DSM 12120 TaxID=1121029 RepID=A0A323USD3_9RHOO|nr:hypothetical protein DNK49_19480 [Azoarcus communis] [Parazoarcus communis SWub3 = DSM 12120]
MGADRRLTGKQTLRRTRKVLLLRHGDEGPEVIELHAFSPLTASSVQVKRRSGKLAITFPERRNPEKRLDWLPSIRQAFITPSEEAGMAQTGRHSTASAPDRPLPTPPLAQRVGHLLLRLQAWRTRARRARELREIDDATLRDIGMSRTQANFLAEHPHGGSRGRT